MALYLFAGVRDTYGQHLISLQRREANEITAFKSAKKATTKSKDKQKRFAKEIYYCHLFRQVLAGDSSDGFVSAALHIGLAERSRTPA